jgi:hypothetical protein
MPRPSTRSANIPSAESAILNDCQAGLAHHRTTRRPYWRYSDQLLPAVGGVPHENQNALPVLLQPDVEMHAVRPDANVVLVLQRPLAPSLVLGLTDGLHPGYRRGGQPRGVRAEQSLQGVGEVAGAPSLEVEPRGQILEALGLPQVTRQDGRGKRLALDADECPGRRANSGSMRRVTRNSCSPPRRSRPAGPRSAWSPRPASPARAADGARALKMQQYPVI